MSKGRKGSERADRLLALFDAGDHGAARRLAAELLADPGASDAEREAAREHVARTAPDRAVVIAGIGGSDRGFRHHDLARRSLRWPRCPRPASLALLHAEAASVISAVAKLAMKAPPPWAALLAGVGVLFLLHGARHRLVLALPGGAALGLVTARLLATALDGPGSLVQPELLWIAGGVGALVCAGWPPAFPVLALAVPGVVVGWRYPIAMRPWLGAVAGAIIGGAIGATLREWVAALAAGGLGAATILGGVLGLLARRPIAAEFAGHPMVLLAAWAVLTVAGAAFHAGRAWPAGRPGGSGQPLAYPPDDRGDAGPAR